ncbi:MAG: RagB/SusD family nutrient uptake outer membrane protein [Proteiniphilum sp.]
MKKYFFVFVLIVIYYCTFFVSCSDYLDVVPDNIPTIDHAFQNRHEAEGFLFGIFSNLPNSSHLNENPGLTSGDEGWLIENAFAFPNPMAWRIAKGEQNTQSPIANYWSSRQSGGDSQGAHRLWTPIRDANVFLDNIFKPFDLEEHERVQWIAEVKFIKAYYYFWLFRMYGPLPIFKENIPISASPEEVQVFRESVEEVVEYIVSLLDESIPDLPLQIMDLFSDLGRPTKPMALALKAQVLTYAASPMYNGNTDYANFIDSRGIILFPQEYKPDKWQRAADALKEAIDIAHEAGHELFDFGTTSYSKNLSESTILAMNVRGAVVERWNPEVIWGDSRGGTIVYQREAFFGIYRKHGTGMTYGPPLTIVEQFYSKNGVPIDEDVDWQGVDWYGLKIGDNAHNRFIREGFTTINLHFNREYRFYGSVTFDGGLYYGAGKITDDKDLHVTPFRANLQPGGFYTAYHSPTGYNPKKVVHYLTTQSTVANSDATYYDYQWPIIRLADLYLMYAEALNETKGIPDADVYEYIDKVRKRSGLDGVAESWQNHSIKPDKPLTKDGMRKIIQRERMIELAFEGIRFWDLRRWKLSEEYMNKPIRGWNVYETDPNEFYKVQNIFDLKFEKKDYLWPIQTSELLKNKNLIQNPGW